MHIRGLALGQFVISLNFARLRIAQVGRYSQRWVGPGYGPSRFFDIARDWPRESGAFVTSVMFSREYPAFQSTLNANRIYRDLPSLMGGSAPRANFSR